MNHSLTEVFSYLKIKWQEKDQINFTNHTLLSNQNITDLNEIAVEGMRCSVNGELSITVQTNQLLSPKQLILIEEKFPESMSWRKRTDSPLFQKNWKKYS